MGVGSDVPVSSITTEDGWQVTTLEGQAPRFINSAIFEANFKRIGEAPLDAKSEQSFYKEAATVNALIFHFILLKEDIIFDFKEGPFHAAKGTVIFENAQSVDGFTVVDQDDFAENFSVKEAAQISTSPIRRPIGSARLTY